MSGPISRVCTCTEGQNKGIPDGTGPLVHTRTGSRDNESRRGEEINSPSIPSLSWILVIWFMNSIDVASRRYKNGLCLLVSPNNVQSLSSSDASTGTIVQEGGRTLGEQLLLILSHSHCSSSAACTSIGVQVRHFRNARMSSDREDSNAVPFLIFDAAHFVPVACSNSTAANIGSADLACWVYLSRR